MNIALFGGSFNPPHIGHIMIAQQVLDFCPVDEVWFLPSYGQSPPKDVAPVEHRLAMTKLACAAYSSSERSESRSPLRVSTIEIDNKLDGETVHILPHLFTRQTSESVAGGPHQYSFIIGSDQLAGFDTWLEWEKLLDVMHFWVFPRYGYPQEPLRKNMTLVTNDALMATDISSTKIRARLKAGLDVSHFVPPAIASYISTKSLYK